MSATHAPQQPAPTTPTPSSSCSCPGGSTSDSGADTQHQPLLAANIDADLSGVQANADVLGHDLADIKIGLGIIDDVLGLVDDGVGTGLGLVDLGLGVVDDVLCGIA